MHAQWRGKAGTPGVWDGGEAGGKQPNECKLAVFGRQIHPVRDARLMIEE